MKRSTAKILRAIILAGWTIAAVVLVIVIQNAGNTIMLQKTVSSVLVVYVCLSPAVCGMVHLYSPGFIITHCDHIQTPAQQKQRDQATEHWNNHKADFGPFGTT